MAILNNNPLVGASGNQGGYNINNSLRFRASASAYLSRTPASAGNRKTFTISMWAKRGLLDANERSLVSAYNRDPSYQNGFWLNWSTTGQLRVYGDSIAVLTTPVYRDPSSWYHIVVAIDTTQATASNRVKIYVNGSQVTALSTANYPSQNYEFHWNNTTFHEINRWAYNQGTYGDQYLTEINSIDGQALTPSSFGETDTITGVWKPKAYTGTYGTNGFYLKFSDIATTSGSNAGLGKDFSGNSNYWTTNNISVTSGTTYDAMKDSPTLTSATVGNYAVLNPLWKNSSSTISNANLNSAQPAGQYYTDSSTIYVSSGKWYAEMTVTDANAMAGVVREGAFNKDTRLGYGAGQSGGYGYNSYDGQKANNGSAVSYGAGFTTNDIIGVALDLDNGTLTFYKNNSSQGTAFSSLPTGNYTFATGHGGGSCDWNFGQRPFAYTPPTGFVALNTYNLPTPTILQGNKYMDATTYTGTGANGRQVTNQGGFEPGMIWIKNRSSVVSHIWQDTTRGVGASNALRSDTTGAESGQFVDAVNSTGYEVNGDTAVNGSGSSYVGWQWRTSSSTITNTSGSITSTVSVNTTAGFSVVTYTGTGANATVGHGLGVAPAMIIVKNRTSAVSWDVYHKSLGNGGGVFLNTTGAYFATAVMWNNTSPTSSVFSIGTGNDVNQSGNSLVAYCWAEIAGFSKFGSYTGNGSADGPFVFTNLKARFIMIKRTDSTSNWTILDTAREGYNVDNDPLYPNLSDAEGTTDLADILSNGFKLRSTDTSVNANAGTYIYACFSSNPFKNSTAV